MTPAPRAEASTALRHTLTTPKIVFLIVAAAAPLGAMVATVPLAFVIGNGPGVPAMFVFAGLTLICFSVGYAAMGRRIVNAGGFYTYLARGLGRPAAVAGGFVALIAYNTITIGVLGGVGYFAAAIAGSHGLDLPWELWAGAGILIVGVLGYRQVELSARVLALLMIGEIGVLVLLDLAVVGQHGAAALPAVSFSPAVAFGAGAGVAMMFAFASFVGFESAALYSEEARDPQRSVPRATYVAVLLVSSFYAFTSWIAVGGVGAGQVREVAGQQLGDLFFVLGDQYLGGAATEVMQALLCTSLLAAALALHNAANRYAYVLGRERVLPGGLGTVHPRHSSPHRASLLQIALSVLVCGAFAIAGLDPYTALASSMIGLGTLGIVLLQSAAAVAVVAFFRGRSDRHWWRTLVAPLLGAAGLLTATVLLSLNYPLLTGTDLLVVNLMPWLYLVAALVGGAYAWWMRAARPARYAELAGSRDAAPVPETQPVAELPEPARPERVR